ncbi:hypothetical protein B9Z55_027692 [Caenorhabditis nigoni]|uniref:Uncharacterized protein n=1 Tax=Caenorhabditis nigoni TaxID=1611254 RepID=A0A2G5SER7_9PELO|nr:hypothetical protein B9Z55_027692 [Caenorhabditis nigoni]
MLLVFHADADVATNFQIHYRPNAVPIFEHPRFNSAHSKRNMIMDHFTEMSVDVQEVLIIDGDEEPVAGYEGKAKRREDT